MKKRPSLEENFRRIMEIGNEVTKSGEIEVKKREKQQEVNPTVQRVKSAIAAAAPGESVDVKTTDDSFRIVRTKDGWNTPEGNHDKTEVFVSANNHFWIGTKDKGMVTDEQPTKEAV